MRLLFGIILGVFLTIGFAYVYDASTTLPEFDGSDKRRTASHGELGRCERQMARLVFGRA